MKRYLVLTAMVLAILFVTVFFDLHLSPTKTVEAILQEKGISLDNYNVLDHENSKFYIVHDNSTLILIKVNRTMGLFWASDYSHYYGTKGDFIDYNMFASDSYTIIYGICNDWSIRSVELILSDDKNIKSDIDESGIFFIKYDGNALLWKQLVALDEDKNEIWSISN